MRFVCFETHLDDFRLATNVGTAFVVRYKGIFFALTCRHVLNGFNIDDLIITNARFGQRVAGIREIYYPGNLKDDIEGSDVADVCVIAFQEHDDNFFDGAYDLDRWAATTSAPANRLVASGFLKQKSWIDPPNVFAGLCFLQFTDAGMTTSDHVLRRGLSTYANPDFDNILGMSGSPVYNLSSRALCGMVVRGGLQGDGACEIYYVDIFDIMQFLDAISIGESKVSYLKDGSIL